MTHPGLLNNPTIPVVDDEDIVRALVARALREAGYRVVQAQHGAAALAVLESGRGTVHLGITGRNAGGRWSRGRSLDRGTSSGAAGPVHLRLSPHLPRGPRPLRRRDS